MATLLPVQRFLITDYVKSVQANVFGLKGFSVTGHGDISMAIMGYKNPIVFFISIVTLMASIGGFIVYQFTKIFDLGPPSFEALHKTELLLFVLFSLCFLSLRQTAANLRKSQKSSKKKQPNRFKLWFNRLIAIAVISTMFFTY